MSTTRKLRLAGCIAGALACVPCLAADESHAASPPSVARTQLPATLPVKRGAVTPPEGGSWTPAWAVLTLGSAAGGLWFWRRAAGGALRRRAGTKTEAKTLVRLSSQALTPQASVHAVQWKGEEYLVACTGQSVVLLSTRPVTPAQGADR